MLEKGRWRLPEGMVRHECGASPESFRILEVRIVKVRSRSMEPELSEGDRLVVNTARRMPALGELFVLWDGDGLVVKRVEPVRSGGGAADSGRARLPLVSANAEFPPYERATDEVQIVGRVLWKVTRA
ncbi:MAG: S24 family peptidase [Paracoccaceae bacterium]|nr:S24 family peptidase [Paracoccaceae bacterium]